jgi:hypothetical protein
MGRCVAMRAGWVGLVVCPLLAAIGCLKPGSLDHREQFKALLRADGGAANDAATAATTSKTDGGAKPGNATKDAGGMAAQSSGCAAACDLIKARCATAGCHAATGSAAGLDLESAGLVMRLSGMQAHSTACTGKTLLDPATPDHSLLYGKLIDPPLCGARMPLGAALATTDIDCMRRWVASPKCGADVAEPDADAGTANAPGKPTIWIEAENAGTLTAPIAAQKDSAASGGQFISVPLASMTAKSDTPGTAGVASYIIQLPSTGSYKIWGRVRSPTTSSDSFWVRLDAGTWLQWNNITPGADWHWEPVHDTDAMDAVKLYDLKAGQHTLNFAYRESGTDLDQFLLTTDAALVPTGTGP